MVEDFEIIFFSFCSKFHFFVKIEKKNILNKSSSKAFLSKIYKLGLK